MAVAKKRPPGLLCATCARRALGFSGDSATRKSKTSSEQMSFLPDDAFESELQVFQLKLRDWMGVDRVETRPCLSVCPSEGMTVERRGKTMVLDPTTIDEIKKQFDPTRQLSFF